MLRFPSHTKLPDPAREALAHFAATSLARQLNDDTRVWRVMEQSWVPGPPLHVVVENEAHEELLFSMSEDGTWRVSHVPLAPRIHTPTDLETETQERSGPQLAVRS
jgi:hypothetical protein